MEHGVKIEERQDGRGAPYYWLVFKNRNLFHRPGSDIEALQQKYISVHPLRLDLTAYDIVDSLNIMVDDD